jgi:hypothetical protein
MLVRSPCRHSRGSWSRSPSPLTTSGTVPQLFLHPTPILILQTQSGKLFKITLSTHDIRYSAPTVPALHPSSRHSRGSWSRSPSPLTTSGVQCPNCSCTPPHTDISLQTQSVRLVKIALSTHNIRYSAPTVFAPNPYWFPPSDTVREAGQDHPLHS